MSESASCYLGYGLHYWLWERPTVAYARHAAIANNLKANRKEKMSFLQRLQIILAHSFTLTSMQCEAKKTCLEL